MIKIVEDYIKNGKEIERIENESKSRQDTVNKEKIRSLDIIYDKRKVLDREESDIQRTANQKINDIELEERLLTEPFDNQRNYVKRIIELLTFSETYEPVEMGKVGTRDNRFLEWQEWIYCDDFLKISTLIAENYKPVNKYSAMVLGTCAFGETFIKLPRSCDLPITTTDINISIELGSFKTIEDAKRSIERKKPKLLKEEIENVQALQKEYFEAVNTYKLSDFDELIEWKCYICHQTFKNKPSSHNGLDGEKCMNYGEESKTHLQVR